MNYKNNKHYLQTHQKIIDELFKEIENNQNVSITSICKAININRTTFYEHFENMEELFEESQNQIYSQFLDKYPLAIANANYDFYLEFLNNVKNNINFYKVFYHVNNNVFPIKRGYNSLLKQLQPYFKSKDISDEYIMKYRIIAYESAFSNVIRSWVNNNCKQDVKDIANILNDCCHF